MEVIIGLLVIAGIIYWVFLYKANAAVASLEVEKPPFIEDLQQPVIDSEETPTTITKKPRKPRVSKKKTSKKNTSKTV